MLLAIDIGNSNVVIGCLSSQGKTLSLFRMVTDLKKTADEYAAGMQTILNHNHIDCSAFEGAIICSVVPPLTDIFRCAAADITGHRPMTIPPPPAVIWWPPPWRPWQNSPCLW